MGYRFAAQTFFVGSYGDYWRLRGANWRNVENGVEDSFLAQFAESRIDSGNAGKMHVVFIARLMPHHKSELLGDALKHLSRESRRADCTHLIGSGFETLVKDIGEGVSLIHHGFLDREQLNEVFPRTGLIFGSVIELRPSLWHNVFY